LGYNKFPLSLFNFLELKDVNYYIKTLKSCKIILLTSCNFWKKKALCLLSINLEHSTPANLRNECLVLFKHGLKKRDESTLKSFFELPLEKELKPGAIRKFEISKFKPLNNFLHGSTHATSDKNIELLAWLIDFPHRPYFQYKYTIEKEKKGLSSLMVSKTGSFAGSLSPEPAFTDYHPDSNFSSQISWL